MNGPWFNGIRERTGSTEKTFVLQRRFCCTAAHFVQNKGPADMKTKFLVAAFTVSFYLTSWASSPSSITKERINQIQVGQTTEADLVQLFGTPTTRYVDLARYTSIDWFRSVPAPPQSYIPIVGSFVGGLDVEAQQLTVFLSPGGRVVRYEVHSSRDTLHTASQVRTAMVRGTTYSK